jgi:hypothetical protein
MRVTRSRAAVAGLVVAVGNFVAVGALFALSQVVLAEGIPDASARLTPAAHALHLRSLYGFIPLVATFWIAAALALIAVRDARMRLAPSIATFALLFASLPLAFLAYGTWGAMGW